MFNKVIMMGRIVNDIELSTTPNGNNVAKFRIAVDRRFQTKGEEKVSDFFNVVVWRQQADFVNRYFGKGKMILIEGELNTRQYTDKNGNNATWYEIIAERVSFTGEKADSSNPVAQASAPAPTQIPQAAPPQTGEPVDDDYPF